MSGQREGWRFPVGVTIFVVGFCAPAAIPLVAASSLPAGWRTLISGALAVGVPEVMIVAATAVMGKEGFAELKRRLGGFFRRYGPPDTVGPTRYRVGLVMTSFTHSTSWAVAALLLLTVACAAPTAPPPDDTPENRMERARALARMEVDGGTLDATLDLGASLARDSTADMLTIELGRELSSAGGRTRVTRV